MSEDKKSSVLDRELGRARVKRGFNPSEMGMAPLSLEVLVTGEALPVDFYVPIFREKTKKIEMTLAAEEGEIYKPAWRERLKKTNQTKFFVKVDEGEAINDYFDRNASKILDKDNSPLSRKRSVVKEMANLNLRVLFGSDLSPRALDNSVKRSQDAVERMARDPMILTKLVDVLSVDYSVYSHSVNVSMLGMAFGKYLGFDQSRIMSLGLGGMLHDVGMSKLPGGLGDKLGELTPREKSVMRQHPRLGYKMLLPIGAVSYDVLMIVQHHHENADGSGYPAALPAAKVPLLARIMRLIDEYDQMTSDRPGKPALTPSQAAGILLGDDIALYGPDLAPEFVRFLGSPAFTQ
jgi:HD-GYP domain-containing protein (c-di-GMP phosphodiesterase class II)